jgi:hypothetical protein
MATASINFSASVTDEGETKTITSNGAISCRSLTSGSQTVGNTYEAFATNANPGACTVIIYNTGTVDVSIRIATASARTTPASTRSMATRSSRAPASGAASMNANPSANAEMSSVRIFL